MPAVILKWRQWQEQELDERDHENMKHVRFLLKIRMYQIFVRLAILHGNET